MFFKSLPVRKNNFWELFYETNPNKYLSILKESNFLKNPFSLSPKEASLLLSTFVKKAPISYHKEALPNLIKLYSSHKASFNKKDLVNVILAFSRLPLSEEKSLSLFKELEQKTLSLLGEFNKKEILILIHSFAKVRKGSEVLWEVLEGLLLKEVDGLTENELSIMIWALTKMKMFNNQKIWACLEARLFTLKLLDVEYTSTIIYSFGKAGKGSDETWRLFGRFFEKELTNMKPRYLSTVLWAFAKAGKAFNGVLIDSFIEEWIFSSIKKEEINVRDIMNVIWGYNKMNKGDSEFWLSFCRELEGSDIFNRLNTQDLLNLAWIVALKTDRRNFKGLWKILRSKFLEYLLVIELDIKKGNFPYDFQIKSHECFYKEEEGETFLKEKALAVYLLYKAAILQKGIEINDSLKENIEEIMVFEGENKTFKKSLIK